MPHLHKYLTTSQRGIGCCPQQKRPPCILEPRRQKTINFVCYASWLPNVRILAPHVPDNILLDYIRAACIEFARQSRILKRDIHIETQDCVADYWPCLGVDEVIQIVDSLNVAGECYASTGSDCQWEVGGSTFWFHPPNSLEISPAPKRNPHVVLSVTAVPSQQSEQVDEMIHERYFEAITDHAVANALLVPPAPDSDPRLRPLTETVQYRLSNFQKAVRRAKVDLARDYTNQASDWRGRCGL